MSEEQGQRRLSAILAADVAGYTRLVEQDTDGTVAAWKAARSEIIDTSITEHAGRIVKHTGDGFLAEFPTVQDAVTCAIAMQAALAENPLEFRMGINLGDVVDDGEDIHGEGVNIAARIEALANPGEVCISGLVFESVRNRVDFGFEDLGEHEVKHVSTPVRVYRIVAGITASESESGLNEALTLPDKPSIAVLPFDNMSGDREQEYFSDGVTEDIITALSKFRWLFVTARNSTFTYKGSAVDIKKVGRELGVRYVLEGSVRRAGNRVRITAQLIETESGNQIWGERYDRELDDIFALQDEISQAIIGVLVPALSSAERKRALRNNSPNLDAWEAYQKGLAYYYRPYSDANHAEARRLFDRAIELDKDFSDAHAMVALMGVYSLTSGQSSFTGTREEVLAEAEKAAMLAVQLDDNNAHVHMVLGRIHQLRRDREAGIAECESAIRLNPNLAIAHHELGFVLVSGGRYADAIPCFDQAIRLSPNDPSRWNFYLLKGIAMYAMDQFETSITNVKEAARLRPTAFWPLLFLTGSLVALGRMDDARAAVNETLVRKPDCTIAFLSSVLKGYRGDHLKRLFRDLKIAGLPE